MEFPKGEIHLLDVVVLSEEILTRNFESGP